MESPLRSRIAALAQAEPELADALRVRGTMIEILDLAEVDPGELRLPADLVRDRLGRGVPLLDRLDLPLSPAVGPLVERLTVAMLADAAVARSAQAMLEALRGHRLHAEQLVGEAVVGHREHLSALAASADLPSALVESVADLAARAVLEGVARRLRPALALVTWDRGYCPICGGRPVLCELAGDGGLLLRCGRCATTWRREGRRCPDCGSGRLGEETADAEGHSAQSGVGAATVLFCDACPAYLKVAPVPRADRLAELLVDDLATWRLDQVALSRGRARQAEGGYRLEHGEPPGEHLDDD